MLLSWLILITPLVLADLPVHCVYTQVLGTWSFVLNTDTFTADLHNPETRCGHTQPNSIEMIDDVNYSYTYTNLDTIEVVLSEPNTATSPELGTGTWTMIYDEGFEIYFEDRTFFTYFLYITSDAENKWNSVCDKTFQGWYRPSNPKNHENWGCFHGYRDYVPAEGPKDISETETTGIKWVEPEDMHLTSFLEIRPMYEHQLALIETINARQSSWKAGINENFSGMSMAQVNARSGHKLTQRNAVPSTANLLSTSSKTKKTESQADWSALRSTDPDSVIAFLETAVKDIPAEELPLEWDWTNVDGVSFLPPVRSQGGCGSCYAQSFLQMISSRIQVQSLNEQKVDLSIQQIVSCGFYTEGCDGGYPTLVGKFIAEFDIVPASCFPESEDAQCSDMCDMDTLKTTYTVDDYYYIGGYYGAGNEEDMLKELRARGPIIGNFEPNKEFMYYKQGIFTSDDQTREETDDPSTEDMRDEGLDWEKVDHSVLIVGYGEKDGVKFWKLQNSWGKKWGEDGYFRMVRGVNESAIESMGEAAIPRINNKE